VRRLGSGGEPGVRDCRLQAPQWRLSPGPSRCQAAGRRFGAREPQGSRVQACPATQAPCD
jgi:hypothetical protein